MVASAGAGTAVLFTVDDHRRNHSLFKIKIRMKKRFKKDRLKKCNFFSTRSGPVFIVFPEWRYPGHRHLCFAEFRFHYNGFYFRCLYIIAKNRNNLKNDHMQKDRLLNKEVIEHY